MQLSSGHTAALPVQEPLEWKMVLRREKNVGRDPEQMVTCREERTAFRREIQESIDYFISVIK